MDENEARRVVDALRERGVPAHVEMAKAGLSHFGVRVTLFDGRIAVWDTDDPCGIAYAIGGAPCLAVIKDGRIVHESPAPRFDPPNLARA